MRRVISVFLTVVLLFAGFGIGEYAAQASAPRIVQIAAGGSHSLALFSDGSLYAWGRNSRGQLGDGTKDYKNTPTLIGTGYTAIAAGFNHTLALKGGALYAWGDNWDGQLGIGSPDTGDHTAPYLIGTGYTAIAAGFHKSLALKGSALYAWGKNIGGAPQQIGTGYTAIEVGRDHSLALKGSELYAWGLRIGRVLGDDTQWDRNTPTLIGTGYTAVAAGNAHSLVLKGSAVYAWGDNSSGQVGFETATNDAYPAQPVGTGVTAIAAGAGHSLALKGSALYAWGDNVYGQLGDGTTGNQTIPNMIGTGYTAIEAGGYHSLALKGSALYAWGLNDEGQLGDGTLSNQNTPSRVVFPAQVTPEPLHIFRFSVKNANLSVGDKTSFTVVTGKSATQVSLLRGETQVDSTKQFKNQGGKRVWTLSPTMTVPGDHQFWAVASDKGGASIKEDIGINVNTSSLEVKGFAISSPVLNVGETVTFKVTTGKLANKVSILDASNVSFVSSTKPSKTTNTKKIWTIQRKVTEGDMGSFVLHARIDSKYGAGPDSETLELKVADNLPRIIPAKPDKAARVKRGSKVIFTVVTNAAATGVWISNDRKEKWWQTVFVDTETNRRTWEVTTYPGQLGSRSFYAQAYRGAYLGLKVFARKILVVK